MKRLLLSIPIIFYTVTFANNELKFKIKQHDNTQEQNGRMRVLPRYISDNISCPQKGSWLQKKQKSSYYFRTKIKECQKIFTANVPLISTYDPEPSSLLWPPLSLHTKVDDISLYFVVQQKINRELNKGLGDNVTVKYHSLIADGINSGVGEPNNKVLTGKFNLRDSKGNSLIGDYKDMVIVAHDNLWSGPDMMRY